MCSPLDTSPDTEFYNHQHDKSRLLTDKEALQLIYDDLSKQYQQLKDDHDEALGSLATADARVEEALASAKAAKQDRAEGAFKQEMDKMSKQLNKTENELAECQGALDKQTKINEELARKVSRTDNSVTDRIEDRNSEGWFLARLCSPRVLSTSAHSSTRLMSSVLGLRKPQS